MCRFIFNQFWNKAVTKCVKVKESEYFPDALCLHACNYDVLLTMKLNITNIPSVPQGQVIGPFVTLPCNVIGRGDTPAV